MLPKTAKTSGVDLKSKSTPTQAPADFLVNGRIKTERVELIDESGLALGILTRQKALELAGEKRVDLIELNAGKTPSRCLLMDYGRFRFRLQNGSLPAEWQK